MVIVRSFITVNVPQIYLVPGHEWNTRASEQERAVEAPQAASPLLALEGESLLSLSPGVPFKRLVVLAGSFVAAGTVFFLPPLAAPRPPQPLLCPRSVAGWSVGCLGGGILFGTARYVRESLEQYKCVTSIQPA